MGVVVFDSPVPGITPAALPTAGLLDELGPNELSDEVFPVVGYGISRLTGGSNGAARPDRPSSPAPAGRETGGSSR